MNGPTTLSPKTMASLDYGLGTLLVTDLSAILRPGNSNYYRNARHDVSRFDSLMNLGDWDQRWHIATRLPAAEAHNALQEPLRCYFDGYCQGKIWIDAHAAFLGAEKRCCS